MQLHVPVVYKQCSVLVCFLENGSSNWFGCILADSYVINRFSFLDLLGFFSMLLKLFKYLSVLFIFPSVA